MKRPTHPISAPPARRTSPAPSPAEPAAAPPPAWEIRGSAIHGRGLFAVRPVAKGERIIEYLGEKITKAESNRRGLALLEKSKREGGPSVFIFELNQRYDVDGDVPHNAMRFTNHSCAPNCEVRNLRGRLWMIALRPIAPGEEFTYDYGYDLSHFLDHPCRCGAPTCAGFIVRTDQRFRLRRLLARRTNGSTHSPTAAKA